MTQLTYILYLTLSVFIILNMGVICVRNGKIYIQNYFPDKKQLAYAIHTVLRIAYYCLNIGLSVWALHSIKEITNFSELIVEVSTRLSFIVLILSLLHFFNMTIIYLLYKHFKNQLL